MNSNALLYPLAILASAILVAAVGCSTPTATDDEPAPQQPAEQVDETDGEYVVEFRDRSIDLYPYVQGFPYGRFGPDLEHDFMVYFETTPEGQWLRHLSFGDDDEVDVTAGAQLGDVDWSTRSFRAGQFNTVLDRYVFLGDEQNDEIFNVYTLDLDTAEIERITDADYIYGYNFSEDDRLLSYIVRHGESEPFNSCLHVRDLESSEDTELWCDEGGDDRLTWGSPVFDPAGASVLVRIQHDGDRNRTNLGRFALDEPGEPELMLERGIEHKSLYAVDHSFDGDQFLYSSSKTGMNQLYRYDIASGESEQLTQLEHDIRGIALLDDGDSPPLLLVLLELPHGTIVEIRDPESGAVAYSDQRRESISIRDHHDGEAMLAMSSVDTPFRMERARLDVDSAGDEPAVGIHSELFAAIPDELAETLVQCDVERIEYETFDEVDGQPRTIHAYLYEPRDQPVEARRLARITAFYGGSNRFSSTNQIMCEAGVTTLSPAVRGSYGFGAEFRALNDGDLGGDDVIDVFYAARWLEDNRGFQPHQIGVYGSSHGGYAAMRALTFPPETNERNESYDFGFGYSHAGISDLMHFYETSNIPDWLVLLAGDPDTEADRILDRSPLTHVERLDAPLLLTHGSHDSRVPVDESRRFFEAAEERDLPVVYEEFDGQGHGISGLENRLRYYRALFGFLESEVDPRLGERAGDE